VRSLVRIWKPGCAPPADGAGGRRSDMNNSVEATVRMAGTWGSIRSGGRRRFTLRERIGRASFGRRTRSMP
jgi:hypothetical protein